MTPELFIEIGLTPAFRLLPPRMDSPAARALVLGICLQESRLAHRHQLGGPARSYAQFESAGLRGVVEHPASRGYAIALCDQLDIRPQLDALHQAITYHDVLCAGFARLLLWTDPRPLPGRDEPDAAWDLYRRTWRPGRPRVETWFAHFQRAWDCVAPTPPAPKVDARDARLGAVDA